MRFRTASATLGLLLVLAAPAGAANLGFAPAQFVDPSYAGGEPVMQTDPIHHTIVYSSHEGTTHVYRPGFASGTTFQFAAEYRNQVKMWTSKDGGKTFKRVDLVGGLAQNPAQNTGFSDPDLTQDEGGRIYNTGINLANDALFSSGDGGLTWDRGTAQCRGGDRPWLAGAKRDEVFMATNTLEGGLSHRVFRSTDGGNSCGTEAIIAAGETPDGTSWTGNGKLLYDRTRDALVEPSNFENPDGSPGIGVNTWRRGDATFTPHKAADSTLYAHWAMIALDDAGGLYLVWDDDPRAEGSTGGCDGNPTPVPNQIRMIHSPDLGNTWGTPVTLARPANQRVLWPWITAGDKGRVNVVWYQTDKVVDLACENAELRAMSATVVGADGASPQVQTADVAGRPIAVGNICQSGTTCVATGEDRRLGDFFTNAIDERGCVMVATADTTTKDPVSGGERNIALPLFVSQNAGPALRGGGDCSGVQASLGLPQSQPTAQPQRRCVSRRNFAIRVRRPRGTRLRSARVYVNGKRVRTLRGRRIHARVNLRGLPRGTFTVKIQAITRGGRRLTELRRYRTCVPRRRG